MEKLHCFDEVFCSVNRAFPITPKRAYVCGSSRCLIQATEPEDAKVSPLANESIKGELSDVSYIVLRFPR